MLFFLLPVFLMPAAYTQIALTRYDSVEVTEDGLPVQNPWAGGLNSPQFSQVDLDGDGRKDLVAFERNFYGAVKTYLNVGTQGQVGYKYAPEFQVFFPSMRNWMLLRDYNCDGREDIFTSVPGGVRVYRNDPGPGGTIRFTLVTPILQSSGLDGLAPLYVAPPDIPSIADVDGDGDLDILSFNVIGSTLEYHKNLTMENYGNCNSLEFELRNACWGYFSEDGNNNNVTLFDTCELNVTDPEKEGRHAGSTVLAIDLTGTGAMDLLLGDITYNNLVMLMNGGTDNNAIMVDQSPVFPEGPNPVNITVFPAAYHLDADNDGLKDLLVAPNNPNTSENFDNVWFYRNEGSQQQPQFKFMQKDFLHEGMIDLGERSYPVFFDADGDGLMDIVAGSYGYFEGAGSYSSRLLLLRNNGTLSQPRFEVATENFAGLMTFNFNGAYPSFGDMDGDGDQDMLLGDEEGRLHLFTNEAEPGEPADLTLTAPNFKNIDIGQAARPQVYDVNGDGLPDLLMGERSGTIMYFQNNGTATVPDFDPEPTTGQFGGIDVMPECCTGFSAPFMTTDSLGKTILYVGSEQGWLYLFDDIDNNLSGDFNLVDSLYLHGVNVSVSGEDINGDGRPEFVYGEFAGGIGLLKYGTPPNLGLPEGEKDDSIKLFPNPAGDYLNVSLADYSLRRTVRISVFDNMGRRVLYQEKPIVAETVRLNVADLGPGIYFLKIAGDGRLLSGKFIIGP